MLQIYFTLDEEAQTPEIKQNPENFGHDYFRFVLVKNILFN